MLRSSLLALTAVSLALLVLPARAVPTTIAYAGFLTNNGAPVDGTVDLVIELFDDRTGGAALAMVNTWVATACAALSWMFAEWMIKGKPSMLGAASGAVAGLVAITPAAGFVGVMGAIVIGLLAGIVCLWGVNGLKKLLGADDSLDVFGIHGVGGILGAILTGVFVDPALGGTGVYDYVANKVGDFDMATQVIAQLWGVGTVIVWSGVVSIVAFKLVDIVIGLRVAEDEEREGLDVTSHGETAYHH